MNMNKRENFVTIDSVPVLGETPYAVIPLNQVFVGTIGSYVDRLMVKFEHGIYCLDAPLNLDGQFFPNRPAVRNYRPVISMTVRI